MRRKLTTNEASEANEKITLDGDEFLAMLSNSMPPPTNQEQRLVMLHGEVNEHSTAQIVGQLLWLAGLDQERPITLIISTYGGSVDEMFSIYDTIRYIPCPVHTIALGKVMSAGVLILAAGEKGHRLVGQSSRIMMHGIRGGAEGSIFEIANSARVCEQQHNQVIDSLVRETKMTRKKVADIMSMRHDHYMTAQEAIKLGIADKIMGK